ncbi:protein shuttle craft [Lasius niger]|uniref:Protein shuttle craft n=2 Tax=Lasius niger TaxID=67767 RepID=A0A0J7K9J0_LASNI|nr:protein shuttle craft [Lasius niger]
MAAWDGSFQTEDPNYCAHSAAENSWTYFDVNSAGNCHPAAGGGRPSVTYERTSGRAGQSALCQIDPQHPSTMVPLEDTYYQEHILPSSSGSLQNSSNNSRNAPFFRDNQKPRSRGNRAIGKPISSEGDIIQSSIVQNSNLQATANEFVPNSIRNKKDRFSKQEDRDNAAGGSFDAQDFRPRSINKYASSSDNRYKGERRYDNRRDVNYRQKNQQDAQAPPRSNYRDAQRSGNGGRNYNKFQNGKYYNRRHQDASFVEQHTAGKARTPTTEHGTSSFTFDRQENKAFAKELQEDDGRSRGGTCEDNDSENASLKDLETQRNSKPKRFTDHANASNYYNKYNYKYKHYYKYNSDDVQSESGGRQTASRTAVGATKYMHKRNNEGTANHKEKNLENWRDRAEDNDATRVQGKSLKNKHKIGMIVQSLSKRLDDYYIKQLLYNKRDNIILYSI